MAFSDRFHIIYLSFLFSLGLQWRLLVSLPFHVLRKCIELVSTWLKPELRKLISSNHYLGPAGELLTAHNLLISITIRGHVNVQEFKNMFLTRCVLKRDSNGLLQFPELQELIKIHWGYPFWKTRGQEDKTFNIERHIFGGEVFEDFGPLDESKCTRIEQLLISRQFERSEGSPWKIYLLHESAPKANRTRLLFSFHHSLGDGQSMYDLLMRLAGQNSDNNLSYAPKESSWIASVRQFLPPRNPLLVPTRLMRNFIKCGMPPPFYVDQEKLLSQEKRVILKSSTIRKSVLSNIARRHSVTFTAVLLSAITGALRKYIIDRKLPVPDFVLCPMPVPLASSHSAGLRNLIQSVEFTLPFGKSGASERLQDCKQTITEAQTSAFPLLVRLGLFIENGYPLAWKPLAGAMPPIILSSFPGPKSSESILEKEHEILDMDFTWNGTKYASVIFTTLTYCDGIRIVLSVDPNAFQFEEGADLSRIMDDIEAELRQI